MRRHLITFASLFTFACLGHEVSYDASKDDAAMATITRAWSGGGMTLSLCEDTATAASTPADGCQIDNVVRGGGLGAKHSQSIGGGCGGCPFENVAYVKGTVSGGGLASSVTVAGTVSVGDAYQDDPYAGPYDVELTCTDASAPCTVTGTMERSGALHLQIAQGGPAVEGDLVVGGAATCTP